MMSIGQATITVSRFDRLGVRVDAYRDIEHMLTDLITNSGDQVPYLVRDKILPAAIKAWDEAKYRDEHPSCNRHDDCNLAETQWREKHPKEQFVPANFHCHDECCEECFGN